MRRATACIGVIHVPKSGGASLRSALGLMPGCYAGPLYFDEDHFGSSRITRGIPVPAREAIAAAGDLAKITGSHRLVIGHYAIATLLDAGCSHIAMQVREPRARLLSLYRYWQSYTASERAEWGLWGSELVSKAESPLIEFLAAPEVSSAIDNQMARQGLSYGSRPRSAFTRQRTLSHFRHHMEGRLAVVEWTSRSDEFFGRVCELLGVTTPPPLGRENVTDTIVGQQDIDGATMSQLERLTNFDRLFLQQLTSDGVLPGRTQAQLDQEFVDTAVRLGFRLTS